MSQINKIYYFSLLFSIIMITGCTATSNENLSNISSNKIIEPKSHEIQTKKRDMQTRIYTDISRDILEKAIVNTMVDEDFYITFIDNKNGVISSIGNKNSLDLNFVATTKEKSSNNVSVRFNVSIFKSGTLNKNYKTVKDELLYEYLFSKLSKSISLEYDYIAKKINIEKKVFEKIYSDTHNNETSIKVESKMEEGISYPYYSIQFISSKDEGIAKKIYKEILDKYKDARLEKLEYYYVIRLGKFKGYSQAKNLYESVKNEYIDSIIVGVNSKY